MVTILKVGIVKPNTKYDLSINSILFLPWIVFSAFAHEGWRQAMQEEYDALQNNHS